MVVTIATRPSRGSSSRPDDVLDRGIPTSLQARVPAVAPQFPRRRLLLESFLLAGPEIPALRILPEFDIAYKAVTTGMVPGGVLH